MFFIQDFSYSKQYSIHEALIKSCSNAVKGSGAYAFATRDGVELLLKDIEFEKLFQKGSYSIVVGIDATTNSECIKLLSNLKKQYSNFDVKIFYDTQPYIFHPKFSFFKNRNNKGSLILGSGNLTVAGLRRNREAFNVINLSKNEYLNIENYWNNWLSESKDKLRDINDDVVLERAKKNNFVRGKIRPSTKKRERKEIVESIDAEIQKYEEIHTSKIEGWEYSSNSKVLVAEIPKSGNRWKQANFDKDTFKKFFGANPFDNSLRVLLRNINTKGSLSEIESRPSITVKSYNYRFELDAASGLKYPLKGKPLGIFVQITTRTFLYHLFMPKHKLHVEIAEWMSKNWTGRKDSIKRITTTVSDLKDLLNKSVFKNYEIL